MTVTEYIESGAKKISDAELNHFRQRARSALAEKLGASTIGLGSELETILQMLLHIAEAFDSYSAHEKTSLVTREAVFALHYFIDDDDAIPDSEEGIGFDDDLIVGRTMLRNRAVELQAFCRTHAYMLP